MRITILQIITTQELVLYFPFSHCRHNGLFKGETYTYFKKVTTAFLNIRKQQVCDLKCLCVLTWVLHCILYMYSPVSLRVPVSCDILYASIPYAQTHKLQDIKGLQPLTNNHDRHEKCTRQRSLWSGYQQTTDSDRIPTISALTCWKWR